MKNDLISRHDAVEVINKLQLNDLLSDETQGTLQAAKSVLQSIVPSAQSKTEISYIDCSNATLKMWIDKVLTDGEYNRIMDKLNEHWRKVNASGN